jgi:hypothetical protein
MSANPPSKEGLNTKAAGIVAGAVMLSRVLGLARELIFAGLFGAGRGMDAFLTAFRVPNLLRDLFAEGAGMVGTGAMVGDTFVASEILAKHDESYMPSEVVDALKAQGVYVAPK